MSVHSGGQDRTWSGASRRPRAGQRLLSQGIGCGLSQPLADETTEPENAE
jgi:hypothetical protein